MIIFKISDDLNEKELEIIKETLLSLGINYQEIMTIDENLYHRYIQLVSDKIENFSEIGKIKSDIKITGIAMKQPPKPTIKSVLDILLQFIEKQEKFNEEQRKFNFQIQKEMRNGFLSINNRIDNIVKRNNLKE